MWKKSFKKYRSLFVSTTLLTLFFIGFLFVNSLFQANTIKDVEYYNFIQTLDQKIKKNGFTEDVVEAINTIKTGGQVHLSDTAKLSIPAFDQYVPGGGPILSDLLINLRIGDSEPAKEYFNQLNSLVADKKERSVKLLSILQIAVAILVSLLYFVVIIQLVIQLSKTDEIEVQSKQETEGIMGTLSEGVFLLDKNYQIGAEQSASLKGMFKSEKDLEGDFLDFISSYVTQKNVELAKEYLELLYGDRVKERLVEELNPLKNIEINIVRRDGSFENNYLDFKFKRVLVDEKVSHLLGSVTDVTKQVLLERELDETREAQEAQLDMLKSILNIDRSKLTLFFASADDILHEVNKTLEDKGKNFSDEKIRMILKGIGSRIHQIKGDAAALGLHRFEFSSHDLEEVIDKIQKENQKITGKNLIPLTSGLRQMLTDLEDLKELVNKFSGVEIKSASADLSESVSEKTSLHDADNKNVDISGSLKNLVDTVSIRNNKPTELVMRGLNPNLIPGYLASPIQTICTQCIRNSIVHGIETPEERVMLGKPKFAKVKVTFVGLDQGYVLFIRDDGQGISNEKILEEAVAKNVISEEESKNYPSGKVKELLFSSGFSTKDEATMDAGRGFGLDVIKRLADDYRAKVYVSYEKGQFFQIGVLFPFAS